MLYIHIPYCSQKCIYCDFFSGTRPDWEKFISSLRNEIYTRFAELHTNSLSSIYIGGGTPSLIPIPFLHSIFDTIKEVLPLYDKKISDNPEITFEVNPEDVTEDLAIAWKEVGINRISMGIQTLVDAELHLLNRRHTAQKALDALEILKRHYNNISVDIIYGIPEQTIESLDDTLKKILKFKPNHISAYALTYEKGTVMEALRNMQRFEEVSEEIYLNMDDFINQKLKDNGFERYEISNYSLPGYKSRHNTGYWEGKEYLGCGPSASSFDGKSVRRKNPNNLKKYIEYWSRNDNRRKLYQEEFLTKEERIIETIFTSLRRKEGLDLEDFANTYGKEESEKLKSAAGKWIKSGDIIYDGKHLELTSSGIKISDFIISNLI